MANVRLPIKESTFFNIEISPPPPNVRGTNKSSTSIVVEWDQLPEEDQNGFILSYTVTYTALPSGPTKTKNVTTSENQATLTGLNEYTNYSITVFASTCLLYTSSSPRDQRGSRMPSSA